MNTIVKEVIIPDSDHMYIEVPLPAGIPAGKAIMTVTLEPEVTMKERLNMAADMCGKGKGNVWMAEDFDAPLEDFAEYM